MNKAYMDIDIRTKNGLATALDIDGACLNLEKAGITVVGIIKFELLEQLGNISYSRLRVKVKYAND